jgi:hypothetical protein
MHTKIRIEWLVGGLILIVVAILIARHGMWRNPVEKGSDDSQGGQVDEIKATDSRRQDVEAAIRALLAEGDELKATFANADMAKLARAGVTVETAVMSTNQSGSDLKMIINADEGVHHTAWTLEQNGVLVVRSLADPQEAILIVGPAL